MKLKLLTAPFDPAQHAFDDRALEAFLQAHDAIDVQPQFFHHEGRPYWSFLVRYRTEGSGQHRGPKTDWRANLDPTAQARYDRLQVWRSDRAKKAGVAAFIILTNRQMASLAERQPTTLAGVRETEGVGEKTAERYGDEILALLRSPKGGAS